MSRSNFSAKKMVSYNGGSPHGGDDLDPQAFQQDQKDKQKLLTKWDMYFPLEKAKPFDVSEITRDLTFF